MNFSPGKTWPKILGILVLSFAAISIQGASARIELVKGSILEGDIRGLSKGTYTIFSADSEVVVAEKDIKSIQYLGSTAGDLRLAGSNTLGEKLVPELAKAFVASRGAQGSQWEQGLPENERRLVVTGGKTPRVPASISIAAHGSTTAFIALKDGRADLGMSSRPIKDGELLDLSGLGDLAGDDSEHTVGLDGLAIVVHPDNPVGALTIEQIAKIFAGVTTDWSEVGPGSGEVHIYARDDKSGTFDTLKHLVLDPSNLKLSSKAKRIESSGELSGEVSGDPNAIGFIGLPYVLRSKALRILECDLEYEPSAFAIKSEEYPLARRLFLYSPEQPTAEYSRDFVEFALSNAGQGVVAREGFVNQEIQMDESRTQEARLRAAGLFVQNGEILKNVLRTTLGASRLSVTFRFRTGSERLDSKAVRDLERLASFMKSPEARGRQLLLLGFADSNGDYSVNLELSSRRAEAVAKALRAKGVQVSLVTGYGEEAPVACNSTKGGAQRNRHVEVWLR